MREKNNSLRACLHVMLFMRLIHFSYCHLSILYSYFNFLPFKGLLNVWCFILILFYFHIELIIYQ